MKVSKFVIVCLILAGCNSSREPARPASFALTASKYFFGADINSSYDTLIAYFGKVADLQITEPGWSVYPPLSALDWEEHRIEQKYQFKKYPELIPGFNEGTLVTTRLNIARNERARLEIDISLRSNEEAEAFYTRVVADFKKSSEAGDEVKAGGHWTIVFQDEKTRSVMIISLYSITESTLHTVSMNLSPLEG